MSIDPHYITDYTDQIRNKIRAYEGEVRRIYSDDKGIPTMGIGFALFNEKTVNKKYVYSYRGGSFEALQAELLQYDITLTEADRSILDQVLAALNRGDTAGAISLVPKADGNEINTGYVNPNKNSFSFTLTEDKVNRLFTATLSEAENVVRSKIGYELFTRYAGSKEMVAMVSMAFNGPGLLGAKFVGALQAEDRAEAWFQIRYQSNGNKTQGIANRRYSESDLFGLYNEIPTEDDYKAAYRMYTRHRTKIFGADGVAGGGDDYEEVYRRHLNRAIGWGNQLQPSITVRSIADNFQDASLAAIHC